MAESLFTTQTPGTQQDPGHTITLGTVIVPAVAGQVTHGRWYFPTPVPSVAPAFVLYNADTQAQLARATFVAPTAGAWNTVALSSPVSVTAGQRLIAAVATPDRYVATAGFFASTGLTNGNLSAPATGSDPIGNGRFVDPGDAYPASTFNGGCYFVDVVFVAGGGGGSSVAPAGVAVPVALGAPAVAWPGSVAPAGLAVPVAVGAPIVGAAGVGPDGLAVPVAVGVPALGWSAAVAPDGLSVAVALGAPVVGVAPVAPDGVAVPVAVGAPSLVWSGSVSPDGLPVSVAVGSVGVSMPGTVVVRPFTGTVTRPFTGTVTRPFTGVVSRP